MSSRNAILARIAAAAVPPAERQPVAVVEQHNGFYPLSLFIEKLLSIGADVVVFDEEPALHNYVTALATEEMPFVNAVARLPFYNVHECVGLEAHELLAFRSFLVQGKVGVAESGAVWVDEQAMHIRLLPFACEHLYIVLSEADLVYDLEEAYKRIGTAMTGYGVFIAGPSKTADIEQSLVIGAHGPLRLTVLVEKCLSLR